MEDNESFITKYKIEITFTVIVAIILIWYYFYIYKTGKSLSNMFKTETTVSTPAVTTTTTVVAKKEEFANDISAFKASGGNFSDDALMQKLHDF